MSGGLGEGGRGIRGDSGGFREIQNLTGTHRETGEMITSLSAYLSLSVVFDQSQRLSV